MKQIFDFNEIKPFFKDVITEKTDKFLKLACFSLAQQIFDARFDSEVKFVDSNWIWKNANRGVIVNKEFIKIWVYENEQTEKWENILS